MKDLFDKISSYNIFNYLLPGVLFVILARALTKYNLVLEDNIIGAFLYYFVGMTISRFGSLILEPLLKKIRFVKFRDYKKYVTASKNDSKIELLSEVNNTYRTITSMMILLMLLKLYELIDKKLCLSDNLGIAIGLTLILIMFLFSYQKQTKYITKRIDANNEE